MNDKNSKLTIKELRGHLDNCSKTEIIELLVQSFKISKEVQSFISVQLKGEDALKEVMENYKKKIKAEFFPVRGNEKLRVSVVKKAMSDLKKVTKESQHIFELMVYFAETAVLYIHKYGDIFEDMGDYLCDVFDSVIQLLNKENGPELYLQYQDRLNKIIHTGNLECWGIGDSLEESYSDLKWLDDRADFADIVSLDAAGKWMKIPLAIREKLLDNVWCGRCKDAVTIVEYTLDLHDLGVLLKGKCQNCGHGVARVVELEG